MKIAVYTITKNEAQFVERWAQSCKEADLRIIVDTGSTDDTLVTARAIGVETTSIHVSPWRFDDARNASLAVLPGDLDLCIALDSDEVLRPGWREALEAIPREVTRPRYRYVWSWNGDGTAAKTYGGDKIHARTGYRWKHPVHETLKPCGVEKQQWVEGLEIHHHPDATKSREQYLPLLELAIHEDPDDDRNAFYYARELYFYKRFDEAASAFLRHLALPRATWRAERSTSMRYLSACRPAEARSWLLRAVAEAPDRREPLIDLAQHYFDRKDWASCFAAAQAALTINSRPIDYLADHDTWTWKPHDLAAISAYWLGMRDAALRHGEQAAALKPADERLIQNLQWYRG